MLPIKQAELKIKDQEQKIRYLLGKAEDPWLKDNKEKLNGIIDLFSKLAQQGLNSEELFDQFAYTNDLQKISQLRDVILSTYNNIVNDTHPSFLVFEHNMNYNMNLYRQELISKTNKNYNLPNFPEGLIRITTQPNKMYSMKNNILFNSNSEDNSITTLVDEQKYYTTFELNKTKYQIICDWDRVTGLDTISYVLNVNDIFYKFELIPEGYRLKQIQIKIDLNTQEVDVFESETSIIINEVDFNALTDDIPIGVILYSKIFKETTNNPYEQFFTMLVKAAVSQLTSQVVTEYEKNYQKDITYGLYGQGAMIGVSQVYELAKTAVRAVISEYELQANPSYTLNSLPESIQSFEDQITDNISKNRMNIIGNTCIGEKGKLQSSNTSSIIRIPLIDMPKVINYQESAGMIKTGYDVVNQRLTVQKGVMNKYLSDGTISKAQYWLEFESTAGSVKNVVRGTYGIFNNKIYDTRMDALAVAESYKYTVHGVQLTFLIDDDINAQTTIPTIDGYKYTTRTITTVKLIIWPEDLSSEGTGSGQITISFKRRGDTITTTSQANKTQIQYGDKQISVYVITLDTYADDQIMVTGAAFDVPTGRRPGVRYYATREASTNLPQNLTKASSNLIYNAHTSEVDYTVASMGLITSGNLLRTGRCEKPNGVLKTAICNIQNYPSAGKYCTPCAPWSTPDPNVTAYGWINLKSEYEKLDYAVDWTNLEMSRPFSDASSTIESDSCGPITIYIENGPVRINSFDLPQAKVDWTGTFPSITSTSFRTYTTSKNIQPIYSLTNVSFSINEIVLPSGTLNQGIISESIISLQRAVEYLQNYASYLAYLIQNLDARLTQVEETLQQVVEILQQMMGKNKSVLGVVADIVGFIGSGVGMFFPLIGLGISIVAQILKGANEINEGDVVTGSMDIVIGGVLAALGVKKWNQRIKKKYGAQSPLPNDDDGLPSYDDVMGKPGYGCISINRNADPTAYGAVRNVWYDFSGDVLVIHGSVYPNTSLQLNKQNEYSTIKITGVETWEKSNARSGLYSLTDMNFSVQLLSMDSQGMITENNLTNTDMIYNMGIDVDPEQYAIIMYLYGLGSTERFSKETAFDRDSLDVMLIANGVVISGQTQERSLIVKNNLKSSKQEKMKWNLRYKRTKTREATSNYRSPINNLSKIFNATNPLIQSMSDQIELFSQILQSFPVMLPV